MSRTPTVEEARAAALAAGDPWEEPAPLGTRVTPRAFPVEAFPAWLAGEITALARFTQTPPDLPAMAALAVLSAAAGGRAVVEIRSGWREPLNLYTVVALPPGTRKSPVFTAMTAPLTDAEQVLVSKAGPAVTEAVIQRKIAQQAAEKAAREATPDDPDKTAQAVAAAQLAEAVTVPVMPRLIADDVTPEAAASLMADQGGRLAVLSAEGGIFATIAGRYSQGTANLDVFLKGWSGDTLRVDRKSREPEYIPAPALTLGLCVQPAVLREIAAMPGFRGRGLLARLLYSVPASTVGTRLIGEPPVPAEVRDEYAEAVQALTLSLAEWTDPAVLMLSPGAAEAHLQAERDIEPRLAADSGDLAGVVDWASKLIGTAARIAGLLHLATHLRDGWGRPIGQDTMEAALRIGEYLTAHAVAAFDHMGVDPVLEDARVICRWLERTRPAQFTRREAHMGLSRSRFPKVDSLDAPLGLLEQHGWIRRRPAAEHAGPGRPPSPAFEVHPRLATETTKYTEPVRETGSVEHADLFHERDSVDSVVSVAPRSGEAGPPQSRPGRISETTRRAVRDLRAQGKTMTQIAAETGISLGSVHKIVHKAAP